MQNLRSRNVRSEFDIGVTYLLFPVFVAMTDELHQEKTFEKDEL